MKPEALVARIAAALDHHMPIVGGAEPEPGAGSTDQWLACEPLLAEPAALGAVALASGRRRGIDRADVALSLFVQGYAGRLAAVAIGGWLLGDAVLDLAPPSTAVAVGEHGPAGVRLAEARIVAGPEPLSGLHAGLVDGHLAGLVAAAHASGPVGEALLWGNVAAACASAFGAFMGPSARRWADVRQRATRFFATARPEIGGAGRLVAVGPAWAWERTACCLWYQAPSGSRCADCSRWSATDRQARYRRVLTALSGG